MICLPNKDPNQFDLFSDDINFPAEPSTAYPPNMQNIMDEMIKPDAIAPSPNLEVLDELEVALAVAVSDGGFGSRPIEEQQLLTTGYNFAGNSNFDRYTSRYNIEFPPLLNGTGGIQDIVDLFRTHIVGIQNAVPGSLGGMGQANIFRTMGYGTSGNALQKHLGLGAIPDCGLFDALMGLLARLLQPLIDLLAALFEPLLALLALLLSILAAILNELLKLLDAIQRLINLALATPLLSLDPCALLFMATSGSPDLNKEINDGIIWRDPNGTTIPNPGESLPPFPQPQ